jgi:hypothetical protein
VIVIHSCPILLPSMNSMRISMYAINVCTIIPEHPKFPQDYCLNVESSRMPPRHRPPLYQLPKPSLLLLRRARLRRERRRHLAHLITRSRSAIIAHPPNRAIWRPRRRRRLRELRQVVWRRSLALIQRRRELRQMIWRRPWRRCMLGWRRAGH